MRVTERDKKLLLWLNEFGVVRPGQVQRWMGVNRQAAQRRLKKLGDGKYIKRHMGAWPYVTVLKRGKYAAKDKLEPMEFSVSPECYRCPDVVDIAYELMLNDKLEKFVPRRRIVQEEADGKRDKSDYVPDGYVYRKDGRLIAVEYNRTIYRGQSLKEDAPKLYSRKDIFEIWYFNGRDKSSYFKENGGKYKDRIKVFEKVSDVIIN